jgi:threonine/homoserine/homoserine lactone efflux protein
LSSKFTPGPNMATLAALTLERGRAAGFAAIAGVSFGLLIVGVLAALGLAAAISEIPALYQALRWGGVFTFSTLPITPGAMPARAPMSRASRRKAARCSCAA